LDVIGSSTGGYHGASAAPYLVALFQGRSKFSCSLVAFQGRLLSKTKTASALLSLDVNTSIFDDVDKVGGLRGLRRRRVLGDLLLQLLSIDKLRPWEKNHGQGEEDALWRDQAFLPRRPSPHGEQSSL
jgi:hypothetical protein